MRLFPYLKALPKIRYNKTYAYCIVILFNRNVLTKSHNLTVPKNHQLKFIVWALKKNN